MCAVCKQCWIKFQKKNYQSHNKYADKSNVLLVGGLYTQNLITFVAPRLYQKYIQAEKREKKKGGTKTEKFTSTNWMTTKNAQITKEILACLQINHSFKSSL